MRIYTSSSPNSTTDSRSLLGWPQADASMRATGRRPPPGDRFGFPLGGAIVRESRPGVDASLTPEPTSPGTPLEVPRAHVKASLGPLLAAHLPFATNATIVRQTGPQRCLTYRPRTAAPGHMLLARAKQVLEASSHPWQALASPTARGRGTLRRRGSTVCYSAVQWWAAAHWGVTQQRHDSTVRNPSRS